MSNDAELKRLAESEAAADHASQPWWSRSLERLLGAPAANAANRFAYYGGGVTASPRKTLAFLGHGRAGKDTACEYLAEITLLRNAGTTSKYLAEYVAGKLGLPVDEAYARRHESSEMRTHWYHAGNEVRERGPTTLIRTALERGEITGGMRYLEEVLAARREGVVDLLVWVDNPRVPQDPTVKFGPEHCDLTIRNDGTIGEFKERLRRFAVFAGLPMRQAGDRAEAGTLANVAGVEWYEGAEL